MTSIIGTTLSRKPVAWFWFAIVALPAGYSTWGALTGENSWLWPLILSGLSAFVFLEPRFRKPEKETIQVDDAGVLRVEGTIREEIKWDEVTEIRIITTDEGPFREDVFFVLLGADNKGCLVPHDAAVRTKLLEELQTRFPSFDNEMVIKAMGCTSKNSFLIWQKSSGEAA